jgi:2'-5' RNA ligase
MKVRWEASQNLHLTLHFLGPTPSNLLEDLLHDLRACAHRHRPFDLALGPLGCLPDTKNPRLFWAGVQDRHGFLKGLGEDSRQILNQYRLFKLKDDFLPHVTLGRVSDLHHWDSKPLEILLPQIRLEGRLPVESMVLYRSNQRVTSAEKGTEKVYEALQRYPLKT